MSPHLTPELILAFRRGRISYDELLDIVLGHVATVCKHCSAGCEALDTPPAPWNPAIGIQTLAKVSQRYEPELLLSHESAEHDLRLLKSLAPGQRRRRVERARRRFRGEAVVTLLLSETEHHLHTDPGEAFHWAELAWAAAWSTPQLAPDTLALACAQMGNARRATGELLDAERIFEHVRYLVEKHPVTDFAVLARILHFEGSLHKDQRRMRKARKVLHRSAMLYRLAEDSRGLARSLLSLADACNYGGETERAIFVVGQALEVLKLETEPEEYVWARHNLACYLVETGHIEEAALLRETDAPLVQELFAGREQFHLLWLDGRIAVGRGEISRAIQTLNQTREGFSSTGLEMGAVLVAAELAAIYAREGRWNELRLMVREVAGFEQNHPQEKWRPLQAVMQMLGSLGRR